MVSELRQLKSGTLSNPRRVRILPILKVSGYKDHTRLVGGTRVLKWTVHGFFGPRGLREPPLQVPPIKGPGPSERLLLQGFGPFRDS